MDITKQLNFINDSLRKTFSKEETVEHTDKCNGCELCSPQDEYQAYKDEEINELNTRN